MIEKIAGLAVSFFGFLLLVISGNTKDLLTFQFSIAIAIQHIPWIQADGSDSMIEKVFGAVSILAGIAFLFVFPDIGRYQPGFFTNISMLIGIFLILFGIFLLKV